MEQQNSMNIQWYPGHMTKTRRMMEEDLKLVDAVCEILDARIPISSRNPDIDAICGKKPRMVILNRIDMADPDLVSRWSSYFKAKGMACLLYTSKGHLKKDQMISPSVHRNILPRNGLAERAPHQGMNLQDNRWGRCV